MIDKFGQVMVYVDDVQKNADFWIKNIGFKLVNREEYNKKLIGIKLTPTNESDTHLVLYDKEFVKKYSPEVNLLSASILFSTYDLDTMYKTLIENKTNVGEIIEINGMRTFNFSDLEMNYFAVREIKR